MGQMILAGQCIGPHQDVRRILCDAEGERRNGLRTTDAELLSEHLVDALARVHDLEGIEVRAIDAEKELATANEEIDDLEKERDDLTRQRDEARSRIAELEGEADNTMANIADWSVASSKAAHAISSLRSDLAIAGARLDCGMDSGERAAYKFCLRADLPDGDCAACVAAKMRRENEGLKNSIEVIREERDRFLIEAQTKAVRPAKAKPAKIADDGTPSLFALMPQQSTATPRAKRKRAKSVH
jgi:chromosome segregation ATPase